MRVPVTTTVNHELARSIKLGSREYTKIVGLEELDISFILDFGIKFLLAEKASREGTYAHEYPPNSQTGKLKALLEHVNDEKKD